MLGHMNGNHGQVVQVEGDFVVRVSRNPEQLHLFFNPFHTRRRPNDYVVVLQYADHFFKQTEM